MNSFGFYNTLCAHTSTLCSSISEVSCINDTLHLYQYHKALFTKDGNQSINVKFVGRRYTTRPGAPTVVSGKHDQKVHSLSRRFLNVSVSVMSWRSEGRVFQAAGPQ